MRMTNKFYFFIISISLSLSIVNASATGVTGLNQKGQLQVEDTGQTEIVDPEEPEKPITPGPGPSTQGMLRIDYVSPLDFGKVQLTDENRDFKALPMRLEDKVRGSFVQITDVREKGTGWVLQVRQNEQFKTNSYDELTGAILSIDKGWANSSSDNLAPTVTREAIAINNIGEIYDIARATPGAGGGVWSINFGASKDNDSNQPITITENKMTATFDNQENDLINSAIQLNIPDTTKVLPKEYQTKITWILGELP